MVDVAMIDEVGLSAKTAGEVLGHLALHYGPGDEQPARRLLELLGCTLVDNGPLPGEDGFCTVLVDGAEANYANNIMFLSRMPAEQVALEAAIRDAVRRGEPDEDPVVENFFKVARDTPELTSHIGIRVPRLEKLEGILAGLEAAAAPGGELAGRIEIVKYRPRPGGNSTTNDEAVASAVAGSSAFDGTEQLSFAKHWIQCFVSTDLCGFGILAFGSTFELDYVFDPFFMEPVGFGAPLK
jgi:hypothetical protein